MLPVVLLDEPNGSFWTGAERFFHDALLKNKLISQEDLSLYRVTDNVQHAVKEVLDFYRIYHSMRYVEDFLLIRLSEKLSEDHLERLNQDFAGILSSGQIEQTGPMAQEANEPEVAHLPRIKLHFNRRNFGRLRQLIDAINHP